MNKNKEAKIIPLPPEALKLLKSQRKALIKKWADRRGGNDPVFLTQHPAPISEPKLEDEMLVGMDAAGIRPDLMC